MNIQRCRLQVIREKEPLYSETRTLSHAQDAVAVLRPHFDGLDREEFVLLALDAKHKPIGWHVLSIGCMTLSLVHPREVFKTLLTMNACCWIGAHNHPSGDPTPSKEDLELTQRLKHNSDLLGVTMLDHIIVGEDGQYYSFADEGRL